MCSIAVELGDDYLGRYYYYIRTWATRLAPVFESTPIFLPLLRLHPGEEGRAAAMFVCVCVDSNYITRYLFLLPTTWVRRYRRPATAPLLTTKLSSFIIHGLQVRRSRAARLIHPTRESSMSRLRFYLPLPCPAKSSTTQTDAIPAQIPLRCPLCYLLQPVVTVPCPQSRVPEQWTALP